MYAYFMTAICAASGLLLIFRMGREKKMYIALGAFLLALGGWVLADQLTNHALSGSWAIWIQRAALLCVIVALAVVMARDIKATRAASAGPQDDAPALEENLDEEKEDPRT